MKVLSIISTFVTLLPEIISLVKTINKSVKNGMAIAEIKETMKVLNEAFENPDRLNAARSIADKWNNS